MHERVVRSAHRSGIAGIVDHMWNHLVQFTAIGEKVFPAFITTYDNTTYRFHRWYFNCASIVTFPCNSHNLPETSSRVDFHVK